MADGTTTQDITEVQDPTVGSFDDFPPDPFDIFDPSQKSDPYPLYAKLRAESPVHHLEADDIYVVSRFDDLMNMVRDTDTYSSKFTQSPSGFRRRSRMGAEMQQSMVMQNFTGLRILIGTDPPDHTTLRRLVTKPFTPRNIGAREERIRSLTNELVDNLIAARDNDGVSDLVDHIAYPLPVIVIAEVMGIPPERREDFKRWSDAFVGGFDAAIDAARMEERRADMMAMFQYFGEVVAERQEDPRDDLISMILEGTEGEDAKLSVPEVVMFCVLLLVAGNETTTNLIGNLWTALCDNPDQLEKLRSDRTLIPSAVEEGLRYDSPVQALFRITTRETELAGVRLPAEARLMPLFAAGNRDESHYPQAEKFLVDRNPTDHMGFGAGIHLCLGAPLARLETQIAFEILLDRLPNLRPAGEPTRTESLMLRGFTKIPVTW